MGATQDLETLYENACLPTRKVNTNGQITIPADWRARQGIEEGEDQVVIRENDDGTLTVIPPQ